MRAADILVKWRGLFMGLTIALAVVCAFFIPRLNVIEEISYFLPDSSPVKQGLDRVEREFPGLELQNNMLYVMFSDPDLASAAEAELPALTSGLALLGRRESGDYTLYQYLPIREVDVRGVKSALLDRWGDSVTVELDIDKNMPANLASIILTGAILVLIILLVMCQSFMEVFLFLFSMLLAVLINMGSNILMPGVSYMTFIMSSVLQMILSMDYSIILMNRYRQEKQHAASNDQAMAEAIHGSFRSILSSALTTVVSLLMLMFMKVKIGPDLGFVLSKGVVMSLLCNFTVLPCLILTFDRAITSTSKKIPSLPFGALARRQIRYKVPLAILYAVIFIASCILQKRTEISFAAVFETEISKKFPMPNPVVLLYDNDTEMAVPAMMDTLDRDPAVMTALSYPGLMLRGYTAHEMAERYGSLSPMITEEMLRLVYYAKAHPERTEKLSFAELESAISDLQARGMVPEGYDIDAMLESMMPPAPAPVPPPVPSNSVPPSEPAVADTVQQAAMMPSDTLSVQVQPDSSAAFVPADTTLVAVVDTVAVQTGTAAPVVPDDGSGESLMARYLETGRYPEVTYEFATRQMTSRQMADILGVDRSLVSTGYRMAGRTRKPATMSPHEMISFIVSKILPDKRYSKFVSAEQKRLLTDVHHLLDSAFIAGPALVAEADVHVTVLPDSVATVLPVIDSLAAASVDTAPTVAQVEAGQPAPEEEEEEYVPTPLERLAEMYMSGRKYSARRVYNALRSAGVKLEKDDLELLYMYAGATRDYDETLRMSPGEMLSFIFDTILPDPRFSRFIDSESMESLDSMKDMISEGLGVMRGENCSVALALTSYPFESAETFEFVDRFQTLSDRSLDGRGVVMGESVIYKEFKEGFPSELLLLTILTVGAIFIIVLLTFKSFVIPVLLIITVLSGVYVNVIVSGIGGTMYFLAYLIVQSILMGATIDYSILFTSHYREERMQYGIATSLENAFRKAGHSIFTSGLILTLAPYVMCLVISDQMVSSILKSLAIGALAAILIILLIQPGVIAICDRFVAPKGAVRDKS